MAQMTPLVGDENLPHDLIETLSQHDVSIAARAVTAMRS
jgi:hypothetical protein